MNDQAMREGGFYQSELSPSQIASRIERALRTEGRGRTLRRPEPGEVRKGMGEGWLLVEAGADSRAYAVFYEDANLWKIAKKMGIKTTTWIKVSGTRWTSLPPTTEG